MILILINKGLHVTTNIELMETVLNILREHRNVKSHALTTTTANIISIAQQIIVAGIHRVIQREHHGVSGTLTESYEQVYIITFKSPLGNLILINVVSAMQSSCLKNTFSSQVAREERVLPYNLQQSRLIH